MRSESILKREDKKKYSSPFEDHRLVSGGGRNRVFTARLRTGTRPKQCQPRKKRRGFLAEFPSSAKTFRPGRRLINIHCVSKASPGNKYEFVRRKINLFATYFQRTHIKHSFGKQQNGESLLCAVTKSVFDIFSSREQLQMSRVTVGHLKIYNSRRQTG